MYFYLQASRVRANFGERQFAYVEGHAHRDAADIEEEEVSMEEMVANFEALPFAMLGGSDREGEGSAGGSGEQGETGGSVVELAQTGPPTKKMKAPIATVGKYINYCMSVCDWIKAGLSITFSLVLSKGQYKSNFVQTHTKFILSTHAFLLMMDKDYQHLQHSP